MAVTGPLDPRIAWQRALIADPELNRTARGIGVMVGAQLAYSGLVSIGVAQLVTITGYSHPTVLRGLKALRQAGWLHVERRGYRGRTNVYRADSPGFVLRSEVITGAEYVSWETPTSQEHVSPTTPSRAESVSPVTPTSPEHVSPTTPSDPNRDHPRHSSFTYEDEERTSSLVSRVTRPSAAQAPALAAVVDPQTAEVLGGLPESLWPLSSRDRRRMVDLVGQRLRAGWSVEQLVECAASAGAVEVRDRPAFYATHVPQTPPAGTRGPGRRPSWCGECDEGTRLVELDDNTAARCPRCHPQLAEALA